MPSRQDVQKAITAIKRSADYEYFFDRLKSSGWIEPLDEEGLFNDPPPPVSDGKFVSLPFWPQSRYLKRVAPDAPDAVLRVVLKIPATDNPRIHEDLIDATLAMPAALAAKLVPKAKEWVAGQYQMLLPEKLADLVAHLADGGEITASFLLGRSLLAVRPDPRRLASEEETAYKFPREPVGWFDDWHYKKVLSSAVPALLRADALATLYMLVKLLNEAIEITGRSDEKGEDYSYIWRPAIENHPQNTNRHVTGLLVGALRDAAETLIAKDPNQLNTILPILESQRWKVFQRISLHLVRLFGGTISDIVRSRLTDKHFFNDISIYHEFWLLARDHFDALLPVDQSTFLGFLNEEYENDTREAEAHQDLQERERGLKSAKHWLIKRLTLLNTKLPSEWQEKFATLKAEFGIPEHPDFLHYSSVSWVGPTSPKSVAELEKMSSDEIIAFLESWRPPSGPMEESSEGMSRVLSSVVSASPERFAMDAKKFIGLDPGYIRGLLNGLSDSLKAGHAFPWEPVLCLCQWVVRQPREIPGHKSEYGDLDPGWVWTRKNIADLLETAFETHKGQLPLALRDEAWSILAPLTDDPDPTPEHEARYGPPNQDPLTLSINSTRGKAMHALVRYALWLRQYLKTTDNADQRFANGFDEMPEVRDVLNSHLDPEADPSLSVRAVFGQWLPWLLLLDPNWTKDNLAKIFPTVDSQLQLREAAWNTYVIYSGVFDDVLNVLSSEYAAAVGRIGNKRLPSKDFEAAHERLAEHMMIFYMRGKLPIGDSGSLLQRLFKEASPELRAHALRFIGHVFHGENKPRIPPEVTDRLAALWEWRVSAALGLAQDARVTELEEFGWWFSSGMFTDKWAISQLLSILRLCRKIEPTHLVVERLADLAEKFPRHTVEALRLIAEGDDERWDFSLWDQAVDRILSTALASQEELIQQEATDLIHLFGAMGIRHYEHLLSRTLG